MGKSFLTAAALALVLAAAIPARVSAQAVEREFEPAPQTLYSNIWVCVSPDAYDAAVERAASWPREKFNQLRSELLEAKQCMLVEEDDVEDMMAPFVEILEERGDKVMVRFTVEFYKKIEYLHRNITRVTFAGWTARTNLRNYYEWLTGKPQT